MAAHDVAVADDVDDEQPVIRFACGCNSSSGSSNHMWQGNIYMQHAALQRVFCELLMNANAIAVAVATAVGGASGKCLARWAWQAALSGAT